ncbi:PilZ domain-containing protein [Pseudomonas sp. RIT-PI-AD]|uniref:PilZ domain-containing protein n=1 Tax=Pseudomonas sp. RIT-PI-AD TaxID=3035294 RepID=UPI0021D8E722|nr:PilZ domain-containing protein [Pseudomonas sp. RIT-PI-AD]
MNERRQSARFPTGLHLEVQDRDSPRRLGRVVDLTREGFLLFGEHPAETDSVWRCRLVLVEPLAGIADIQLDAECLWNRPGADGRHCWAGFHITGLAEDQAAALDTLLRLL